MDSILLQKQVRDNAKDLQDFCKELQEWGDEMKKKDESLKRTKSSPPEVSSPKNKFSTKSELDVAVNENKSQNKKIKGIDYAAWDKFDADAYCAKLDKGDENSSPESELSDEIDETNIDLANSEKEKGNAFVKKQKWDQAINCYTQAIKYYAYDPIYYANRALCHLKLEKYHDSESDCTTALQLDKTYVKAYQRRAAARENLNQITEAHSDILKVLEFEPNNKESKAVLLRLKKKLEKIKQISPSTVEEQRPVSKFTLSRQKRKDTPLESQTKNVNKRVEALTEHIVERKAPSSSEEEIQRINLADNVAQACISTSSNMGTVNKYSLLDSILLARHDTKNIELFTSIQKPPNTRSKKPLKRIEVVDVNLETEKQLTHNTDKDFIIKETKSERIEKCDLEKKIVEIQSEAVELQENKDNKTVNKEDTNEDINIKEIDSFVSEKPNIKQILKESESNPITPSLKELNLTTPKTSVQFYNNWKTIKNNKQLRGLYLLKIKPNDLPVVFKESLESQVFGEILETISDNVKNNISFVDYLLALTKVKRFGALVMFMSPNDKKCVLNIVDYLKENNGENIDIDHIIKLYEL